MLTNAAKERDFEMTTKTIPERKDISDNHKWDLTELYESDDFWENMPEDVQDGRRRSLEFAPILFWVILIGIYFAGVVKILFFPSWMRRFF